MNHLCWFLATIRLRRLLLAVHIISLNMLQPIYTYKLPEGTIQEGFKCPVYDYRTWRGHVFQMKCGNRLVFHCAKEYESKKFIKACAKEKHCLSGEEPLLRYTRNDQFEVVCRKCFDVNRFYNPSDDTLSSTISQCPEQKLDCDYKGVRECPIDDPQEIYFTNRKCMCDARNNYVPDCFPHNCGKISRFYCSSSKWEATSCFLHDSCPKGEERLIKNFTCVKRCDEGNFRPDDSDDCIPDPHYTASTPTPPSVFSAPTAGLTSALTSDLTSASTLSTSSPTTIKSYSPSFFKTSSPQRVSTTDTGATTDHGKIYGWILVVVVVGGSVAVLIVLQKTILPKAFGACIGYFIKTILISAWKSTFTGLDGLNLSLDDKTAWKSTFTGLDGLNLSLDDKTDSVHIISGIDDSSSMTVDNDTVSVNPIADINDILNDDKEEMAKSVLKKCYNSLITNMNPGTVCPLLFEKDILEFRPKRDIDETNTSTDKNIAIFNRLREKLSINNYDKFKRVLFETKHTELIRELQTEEEHIIATLRGEQSAVVSTEEEEGIATVEIHDVQCDSQQDSDEDVEDPLLAQTAVSAV